MSLEDLRRAHPWPDIEGVPSYRFSLDGGGRHHVVDLIKRTGAKVMVEVGCFLCGSSLTWFDAAPDLTIIGIDPWAGNWDAHMERWLANPRVASLFKTIEDVDAFRRDLREYGPYRSALANVRAYRDQFIPIQGLSPAALQVVADAGVVPDLIYIDAGKISADLDEAYRLFPTAKLTGDDWGWGAEEGYPMRQVVEGFAAKHGHSIVAERQTWVLVEPSETAAPAA
jgi:hypothetical protein